MKDSESLRKEVFGRTANVNAGKTCVIYTKQGNIRLEDESLKRITAVYK